MMRENVRLDEKDLKIIEILRENARASYSEIAREVGLSESAVRKRIASLIKKGVIRRFTIDYEVGNEIRAAVLIKVKPPTSVPEVSRRIVKGVKGVERLYEVAGNYDILAILRGTSIKDINESIDNIRGIDGVADTNTLIILRAWP